MGGGASEGPSLRILSDIQGLGSPEVICSAEQGNPKRAAEFLPTPPPAPNTLPGLDQTLGEPLGWAVALGGHFLTSVGHGSL